MRKILLSGTAAVAISAAIGGAAIAADLPIRKAAPPEAARLLDWTGFYIGGHIGYGQSKFSAENVAIGSPISFKPTGLVGGVHFGQNWQVNTFVYGWEADLSATGWHKQAYNPGTSEGARASVKLLSSLRGRMGMTFDRSLLYVTGGLAYTKASFMVHSSSAFCATAAFCGNLGKFGWVAGLGAEWKQTQNFSWRLEGLYYRFNGSKSGTVESSPAKITFKDAWVVRLGATHHF